jgi:hypothetical protein
MTPSVAISGECHRLSLTPTYMGETMVFPFKRVASSLLTIRSQIDAIAPGRSKDSDGTIGDAAHQGRKSDHNPNQDGVVTAIDITHDPAHGVNAGEFAEMLRVSKDPRIKYVISNARIFSSPSFSSTKTPWEWRPYDGINAHTKHFHLSVLDDEKLYDDTRAWPIDRAAAIRDEPKTGPVRRCTNIVATVFGGHADFERSAYDSHVIGDDELGVALPFHFKGTRPKVRVTNQLTGKSVDCDIVDVGPWNTNDPYWGGSGRPEAESGVARDGRPTNHAGIDLTPAAARIVGVDGKGRVDWEFVVSTVPQVILPSEDPTLLVLKQRLEQVEQLLIAIRQGGAVAPATPALPKPQTPETEVPALLQQVLSLLKGLGTQPTTPGTPAASTQADQLRKALDIVSSILAPGGTSAQLGQVNGALGQTLGKLLDGKKSAIGIIGALVTSLLSHVPAESGLGQVLALLTPASGLSQFTLPIFLAMTAWGLLGKFEKWFQGTAPLPQPAK